jgi:hypothetical protein
MNTYLASSLADDRRREYRSEAAAHADAYAGIRTARLATRSARRAPAQARRHAIHPVRSFRTWLAAGLL